MKRPLAWSIASLLLASPAFGGVLQTAPVSSGFSGDYLICWVQNVSAAPREVTIAHLDFSGQVVLGPFEVTVPPGASETVSANPIPAAASCRFDVAGSSKNVRASAVYYDPNAGQNTIVLPAE